MRRNLANWDRVLRVVIGIFLIFFSLLQPMAVGWKVVLFVIGFIGVFTGFLGY